MSDAVGRDAFCYRLRVRYHECDGQRVVFNARYGEYADVAAIEYARALFGAADAAGGGIDWRLVQQQLSWKAPAVFDDVLQIEVSTLAVGTSSFTLLAEIKKLADATLLCRVETVYVVYDEASAQKAPLTAEQRTTLHAGTPGLTIDASGHRL